MPFKYKFRCDIIWFHPLINKAFEAQCCISFSVGAVFMIRIMKRWLSTAEEKSIASWIEDAKQDAYVISWKFKIRVVVDVDVTSDVTENTFKWHFSMHIQSINNNLS